MSRLIIALTGPPGCGKTTTMKRLADLLKNAGIGVGGIVTTEIRGPGGGGDRRGFMLIDLASGESTTLVEVGAAGPRVGKYCVNIEGIERLGVSAIMKALRGEEVVIIDEVGPMELMSKRFQESVYEVLEEARIVVLTVHHSAKHPVIDRVKAAATHRLVVSRGGADEVARKIFNLISSMVRGG